MIREKLLSVVGSSIKETLNSEITTAIEEIEVLELSELALLNDHPELLTDANGRDDIQLFEGVRATLDRFSNNILYFHIYDEISLKVRGLYFVDLKTRKAFDVMSIVADSDIRVGYGHNPNTWVTFPSSKTSSVVNLPRKEVDYDYELFEMEWLSIIAPIHEIGHSRDSLVARKHVLKGLIRHLFLGEEKRKELRKNVERIDNRGEEVNPTAFLLEVEASEKLYRGTDDERFAHLFTLKIIRELKIKGVNLLRGFDTKEVMMFMNKILHHN